jgi:hypothetical protein
MPTDRPRNRHQKAAHRPGELRVSRAQVAELVALSTSEDADERLTAAKYLCPCHVRGRHDEAWQALLRLMQDAEPKVRAQAWHALEDGGVPPGDEVLDRLQAIQAGEADRSVRAMIEHAFGPVLAHKERRELAAMRRRASRERGKCDFCGARNVFVERDYDTMIPTSGLSRPALICEACAAPKQAAGRR